MSIDRIGKPSNPAIGSANVGNAAGPSQDSFQLGQTGAAVGKDRPGAVAVGSVALDQLRSGEISLDQYLDTRVDEATRHLAGRLGDKELNFVKRSLREQLSTDPVLTDLVRQVTASFGAR